MKPKEQENHKNKCKILQQTIDGDLSKYGSYMQNLINSLTQNDKIWLNPEDIFKLNENLQQMFIGKDNAFGKFISYLQ